MHIRRIRKRFEYLLYFTLGWAFVGGLLWVTLVGLPTVPRGELSGPEVAYEELVVESVDVVAHDGFVDIVARIRNPNPQVGVADLPATFVLSDATGAEAERIEVATYILPGSLQYLAATNVAIESSIGSIVLELPENLEFLGLPSGIELPNLATFPRRTESRTIGEQQFEAHTGVVSNSSDFNYGSIELTGVATDARNTVVGIAQTVVGELSAGEQREFTLLYPTPVSNTQQVLTLGTTNLFRPENIIPIEGDPNTLR